LYAGAWPEVRRLEGIATSPILRPDGSLAQAPGFDAPSGRFLVFDPSTMVGVAEHPTRDDAIGARDGLLEVVQDFPFMTKADCSAWLALVLTLVARSAIDASCPMCPMWTFTANIRGVGKSRLVDIASIIVTGRAAPRATQPDNDEEARKLITSVVIAGDESLFLDNVDRPLGGSKLDSFLTGENWKDRLLGLNVTIDLPIRTVLTATGNNLEFRGDMIRRVIPVRLESDREHPEDRNDFKIKRLLHYVRQHRPRLVAQTLTILRAWYANGCPRSNARVMGGFEGWADLVPHVLTWIALPDPQDTRAGLEQDDPKLRAAGAVIRHWPALEQAAGRVDGVTVREALDRLCDKHGHQKTGDGHDELREALAVLAPGTNGQLVNAHALGNAFRTLKKRMLGGMRLVDVGTDTHTSAPRWRVQ
jgi:putative DNA primase/helicase